YLTGFIISILLTLAAYFAVVKHFPNVLLIILTLAIAQLIVQLIFFLHLNKGPDKTWNFIVLASTVGIVLILVVGTIWIMYHLNYNMTPGQMTEHIMRDENMQGMK
ncbi:MAG TPA: cytochrome o ubiquinol oxidase subunit IV, partial [Candidatus Limnocylindria bacterium]|nr:cytochrome o ubiquinol oxidase subunit IV [Candidatus Limnocylindria bacterium]